MLVAGHKVQKPRGREEAGRVLEGVRVFPAVFSCAWFRPVALTSSHGTAGLEAAEASPSSDLLSATEGSSVLTSLIRNHQFTFISAETRKGPTFTFHSGLCTEQAALEDVSLPSALLQFNFACKLNLPPGIS